MPAQRITRSLKELRRHLPEAMPLSGLSIGAVADRVVVKEGAQPLAGGVRPVPARVRGRSGRGRAESDRARSRSSRRRDPRSQIDRGYDLHEAGRLQEAEAVYRKALEAHGPDALLLYNLGVLLEDMERKAEAMEAYQAALHVRSRRWPTATTTSRCCARSLGRAQEAIRHMAQYRRLTAAKK